MTTVADCCKTGQLAFPPAPWQRRGLQRLHRRKRAAMLRPRQRLQLRPSSCDIQSIGSLCLASLWSQESITYLQVSVSVALNSHPALYGSDVHGTRSPSCTSCDPLPYRLPVPRALSLQNAHAHMLIVHPRRMPEFRSRSASSSRPTSGSLSSAMSVITFGHTTFTRSCTHITLFLCAGS